jgi:hypothetical protein
MHAMQHACFLAIQALSWDEHRSLYINLFLFKKLLWGLFHHYSTLHSSFSNSTLKSRAIVLLIKRRSLAKSGYKWDPLYRTPLTLDIYLPFSFVQQLTLPFSPPDIGVQKLLFTSNSTLCEDRWPTWNLFATANRWVVQLLHYCTTG